MTDCSTCFVLIGARTRWTKEESAIVGKEFQEHILRKDYPPTSAIEKTIRKYKLERTVAQVKSHLQYLKKVAEN